MTGSTQYQTYTIVVSHAGDGDKLTITKARRFETAKSRAQRLMWVLGSDKVELYDGDMSGSDLSLFEPVWSYAEDSDGNPIESE